MSTATLDKPQIVFRRTNGHIGRKLSVTPANSAMRELSYGRIVLDASTPSVSVETAGDEVALICLGGKATAEIAGEQYALGRFDCLYVPRDHRIDIRTETGVDIAECRAPITGTYPLRYIRYAEDVASNPGLSFKTGGENARRHLNILIGKNVEAGRLMAGVTWSEPGHWTSWPPHEHESLAEELYVYFDLPPEAFGIQLVYTDKHEPERVEVVRDGDAVLMPKGYHPNVSIPGHPISFLWVMAAHREVEDRLFGVVNVHPDFAQAKSGLEAGRK
jgi:5-deoxy-glucuronate isomerase